MRTLATLVLLTAPLALIQPSASEIASQSAASPDGAALYTTHCASCHGRSGRGDGPVAEFLKVPPADLTQIVKYARGAFPAAQLTRIIDGRQVVRAHGDSKMPVWGDAFSHSLTRTDDAEVRQKIDALVRYLQTIQERQARRDEPPAGMGEVSGRLGSARPGR
jgi:mono/diheme cytochrome c family protein